jgi:hypothetical protein
MGDRPIERGEQTGMARDALDQFGPWQPLQSVPFADLASLGARAHLESLQTIAARKAS